MADTLSAATLRGLFDGVTDHTVAVEEDLMLLDPGTLDLLPAADRVTAELGDRVSLRPELPAAQVETASPVCDSIAQAAEALAAARTALTAGVAGWGPPPAPSAPRGWRAGHDSRARAPPRSPRARGRSARIRSTTR